MKVMNENMRGNLEDLYLIRTLSVIAVLLVLDLYLYAFHFVRL